ncbi:glycosyltransferase family 4 protein [Winogradskya humida]|uniref:Glycosyl transferase family 1 domain-containing protein n=1 Tax=Winogradskya humida TaxID=113566 RepID=A0ABQ3ZXV2_9ACTN|nr:glycosyltransferase [Actinoplanes humidus]GIE23432.1 hypothetical protein Ahu01nite_065340 [Actinoplanes humidus]
MTRIALVTHGFALGGGVPTIAQWLQESLTAHGGYSVDIHDLATSRTDPASRRLTSPSSWRRPSLRGEGRHPVPHQNWGANAVEVEVMRYHRRRELTETLRGYDLIQVVAGSPAWAAPVLGCGRPVVVQVATTAAWERAVTGSESGFALRRWRELMTALTSRIESAALGGADVVLVENDAMLDRVHAGGHPRAWKVAPGIDTGTFVPAASGWCHDGPLLTVCRLNDSRKNLELMVRAYGHLVERRGASPPLILAGYGSIPPALGHLIHRLGLTGRIRVCADVTRVDLVRLYQQASIFLQTSAEEGLGIAVLEAMACGLPVVATATHGTRETVIDGETGWLVEPATPDVVKAVADKVEIALDSGGSRAGLRGRARCVAEFSADAGLRRFLDVYDAVLHRRSAVMSGPA